MSRVVYLPRRPMKRSIRSLLARLRSTIRPPRRRRPAATDPDPRLPQQCAVYPISANGVTGTCGAPAPGTLEISCRRSRGRHIIELSGELTVRTRDPLGEALEDALEDSSKQIVLDLSSLTAIDHAGLSTILTAHMRAGDELEALVVVPGPWAVQRVLEDAECPFSYAPSAPTASGPGNRAGGATRSRGRRTGLHPRLGRGATRPHSTRRSGSGSEPASLRLRTSVAQAQNQRRSGSEPAPRYGRHTLRLRQWTSAS